MGCAIWIPNMDAAQPGFRTGQLRKCNQRACPDEIQIIGLRHGEPDSKPGIRTRQVNHALGLAPVLKKSEPKFHTPAAAA